MIHYIGGGTRPWQSWCTDERKNLWRHYARKSFWDDFEEQKPSNFQEALLLARKSGNEMKYREAMDLILSDPEIVFAFANFERKNFEDDIVEYVSNYNISDQAVFSGRELWR